MDDRKRLIRNLATIVLLVGAADFAEFDLLLSMVMRPALVSIANAFGIGAVDQGAVVQFGHILLPWTRDCSGLNTLLILWAACIWFGRNQPNALLFYGRLLLCVPVAMAANILRILTIALYRYVAYPEAESVELHYLFGFFWLIPALFLLIRDFRSPGTNQWTEMVYIVVLASLLASVAFDPGGMLVVACAVLLISQLRTRVVAGNFTLVAYPLWIAAGLTIASLRMESLWIPWLLTCPRLIPLTLLTRPSGWVVLLGTVPVLAMHDYFQFVVIAALGWNLWRVLSADVRPAPGDQARLQFEPKCEPKWWKTTALAGLAFAPFFLPALVGVQSLSERPPPGVMTKQVTPNGYQVRVVGQPAGMSMYWYSAFSDGRHHTVEACMRFRGITLENVDSEEFVFMGDDKWYREFFIQGGHLAVSYGEYLVSTLVPLSDAGVHIIVQAPKSQMSASYFARHSEKLAARIFKMHAEAS